MAIERTPVEIPDIVAFHAKRLSHVVDIEIDVPFVGLEIRRVGHQKGGHVVERDEWTEVARLEPRILRKLRAKAMFSMREDLAKEGQEELADHIIFTAPKMEKEIYG